MKKLLTLLLLCCSLNLSAQGLSRQEFYNGLPVRVWNSETYFFLANYSSSFKYIGYDYGYGIPWFMPKSVKNLTVYKWNTRSEFGRDVPTTVKTIWDATYKDGKLRTLARRGRSEIFQYVYDGRLLQDVNRYDKSDGRRLSSWSCSNMSSDITRIIGGESYIVESSEDPIFKTYDGECYGYYYTISVHDTCNKINQIQWRCSRWYFINNFGGISALNSFKKGVVKDSFSLRNIIRDNDIRYWVSAPTYINEIGLPTNKDAFECLSDGWLYRGEDEVEKYWYTYEYE